MSSARSNVADKNLVLTTYDYICPEIALALQRLEDSDSETESEPEIVNAEPEIPKPKGKSEAPCLSPSTRY